MKTDSTRMDSLKLSALLLSCTDAISNLRESHPLTGFIILRGVAGVAKEVADLCEPHHELAVAILISVLDSEGWEVRHVHVALDALNTVAFSAINPFLCAEAATALCRVLAKRENKVDQESRRLYSTIIDFLQFPDDSIREEALLTLELCTRNGDAAAILLSEYAFTDNITTILATKQLPKEHDGALRILFNCSRNNNNSEKICLCSKLLEGVIETVTNEHLNDNPSRYKSLEIVLNIMKSTSNHVYLREHTELLPWLATAASTIEGESMKRKLVQAIIDLSKVYLESGITNRFLI
jgi:hypothetical protein